MKRSLAAAVALVVLAACSRCFALEPREVLVVANQASADSVQVARTYMELRAIPPENLLLVRTSTAYDVSAEDYESQIRQPIVQHIKSRKPEWGTIKCICTIYGMPVRVGPTKLGPEAQKISDAYDLAARRAALRLGMDMELLQSVGSDFPSTHQQELRPLVGLFTPRSKEPAAPGDVEQTIARAAAMLKDKQTQLAKIDDANKQALAARQIMALQLDLFGTRGLIAHVQANAPKGAPAVADLQRQLEQYERSWTDVVRKTVTPDLARQELDLTESLGGQVQVFRIATPKALMFAADSTDAAVDSELATLFVEQPDRRNWIPNTLNPRIAAQLHVDASPLIMTSRIDGPTKADALRIITDSVAVQRQGLAGKYYIDAAEKVAIFDANLRQLADFIKSNTKMQGTLDTRNTLFAKGECPDAAIYVGWYSLRRYVPAFTWSKGAVGWHVASFEAQHLHDPGAPEWVPQMIRNGVCATIGAVNEPFLSAFPTPTEFFPLLLTGKFTVAEVYWQTNPMASWRMLLIADPLYNPFQKNPQVDVTALPKGLLPSTRPAAAAR